MPGRVTPLGCAAIVAIVAACTPHTAPVSPAAADAAWQIVGHRIPGVSALTAGDAARWHGRFIQLQPRRATNGSDTCDAPSYVERTQPAGPFLDLEYRVLPQALDLAADTRLQVIEVSCGGRPWAALGGRLLAAGDDRVYAVWDGVFFVLRRTHL
jgi:hypothetical protein